MAEQVGFLTAELAKARQQLRVADGQQESARLLYRDGWSNRRIAEKLKIPVSEARRLTR